MIQPVLLWFRHDLRLADNPALEAAMASGAPIVPVFVWSPADEGTWPLGAASKAWLHLSLSALDADLRARGSRLILLQGPSEKVLPRLAIEVHAQAVFANRRYEPAATLAEERVGKALAAVGIPLRVGTGSLLFEPGSVRTKAGAPYQVFTPFWRACLTRWTLPVLSRAPKRLPSPKSLPNSIALSDLSLLPDRPWAKRMVSHWTPGEAGAQARLQTFCAEQLCGYTTGRDRPALAGVSRLSPHLHFGEIGPRQIWQSVMDRANAGSDGHGESTAPEAFLRELGWREFSHHVLFHFPHTDTSPLRARFADFPWARSPSHLRAWQQGRTGYPLVDAGMRELWATGFMHNRVRMVAASFLVKHLLRPWQEGARWFWDTLVDADLAQNSLNWQWSAGCGADAAPYFRIFNPTSQAAKFDPDGLYIRRWVPELARLPTSLLFSPWTASAVDLRAAGITLGKTYPNPIVDHATARERALAALASTRGSSTVPTQTL